MEKECIVNGYLSEDQIACFELLDKENIWSDYADFRVTLKDGTFIYVTDRFSPFSVIAPKPAFYTPDYEKPTGRLVIPHMLEIDGYEYDVRLSHGCFKDCDELEEVVIWCNDEEISWTYFDGCTKLKRIVLKGKPKRMVGGPMPGVEVVVETK